MNPILTQRWIAKAAELGSSSKTLKGAVRFLVGKIRRNKRLACVVRSNFGGPAISRPFGPSSREAWAASLWTPEQREDRRAKADASFRRRLVTRLRRELETLGRGLAGPTLAEARQDKAIRARVAIISPKSKLPERRFGVCPLNFVFADQLGYDRRGKNATFRAGYSCSLEHEPGHTEWKNGKAVAYTRATRITTIRSVWSIEGATIRFWFEGTRNARTMTLRGIDPNQLTANGLLPGDAIGVKQRDGSIARLNDKGICTGVAVAMPSHLQDRFGPWEHGKDAAECRAEIVRKQRTANAKELDKRRAALFARFSGLVADFEAARSTGACRAGIEAWATVRGISLADRVPVIRLLSDPDPQARRVGYDLANRAIWAARGKQVAA